MNRAFHTLLPLLVLSACNPWISEKLVEELSDRDGDGLGWEEDCDDEDASVGVAGEWYVDADGDGVGSADAVVTGCGQPVGAVAVAGDCDDGDDGVLPGADEIPYDAVDQDCSGADLTDVDGDGYDGKDAGGADCDDEDASIHPDASDGWYDGVDQDCDGDPGTDMDGDGFDAEVAGGADCDDQNAAVHPATDEVWYDGVDQDCDGADDYDRDGDGERAEDWGDDCDDTDDDVNPMAEEICSDGVDNDCDGRATCGIMGETDMLAADGMRYGASKGDQAGYSLAGVGDFDRDADGLDDLVVGAPYADVGPSNSGAAYVVSGPVSATASLAASSTVLTGESASDSAGFSVDGAGDLDADGAMDLIVGTPKRSPGDANAGAVYLVLGPVSGTLALDDADSRYVAGDDASDNAGAAVAGVGDLNRDGEDDVAIGATGADSGAGAVYILDELRTGELMVAYADGVWLGEAAGDAAGGALDGPGDVDGDGYDDVLVGAGGWDGDAADLGVAYLLLGTAVAADDFDLEDADARLIGENAGDGAGTDVCAAGDANGDGYADLLVGAPYDDTVEDGAGVSYLVLGPVGGDFDLYNAEARVFGVAEGGQAGSALASGDLDGDGAQDLAIGAPRASSSDYTSHGAAYVLYGPLSGDLTLDEADARIDGTAASLYFGMSLAIADDLDGDGMADLIVGGRGYAPTTDDLDSGGVWIFLGGGL